MDNDPELALLRHSAYISLDQVNKVTFSRLAKDIENWQRLVTKAEANALSVLLYRHIRECEIDIPDAQELTLKALFARHRRSNRERSKALSEIAALFSDQGIDFILLKGMALLNCLYSDQSQRPMGDIDILVARDDALKAQQCLRDIGFRADDRNQEYLYDHHHLPVAVRADNHMTIQVEIHHDALSGDAPGRMPFEAVFKNRNTLNIDGQLISTMGHKDMLKHLCHHTFEPCEHIKLGAIADIYGYASRYFDAIDWDKLENDNYFIINTLRCLHFLTPLPTIIADRIGPPGCEAPEGVGRGFTPLSNLLKGDLGFAAIFHQIFRCSEWWLHIYYVVPPENTLLLIKWVRHPLKVCRWIGRRIIANLKSKASRRRSQWVNI